MTSEITLFVNPTAGRGRGAHAAQPAARALRDAGCQVRVVVGTDATDALVRARQAADGITGYADGERIGPLPLVAETVPGAVRLLV